MIQDTFRALVLTRDDDGKIRHAIQELATKALPDGDVLVAITYSSLNYKDGMAIKGKGKIVRQLPMIPGCDLAGTVLESMSPTYHPGDNVLLTGWGVGERYWGGYSQRARLKSEWLVPLPDTLDAQRAMAIGSAGLSAMLCVMTLEDAGVPPEQGPVLVSGAAGGVGSVTVSLLANLGYQVVAVTGRADTHDYLRALGAAEIIDRTDMAKPPRPLETQRWAGAVDTVGGTVLARVLAETRYGGCVVAIGLVGGAELSTTVMPFILRGVSLRGVDVVMCPTPRRKVAWERLARELPYATLDKISQVVSLEEVPYFAEEILAGRVQGRVVVDVNA